MVDDRRFLFDDQLDRQLCRSIVAVVLDVSFSHGVKDHADGVFARGEGAEIAVIQLDVAIRIARVVVGFGKLLRPVINCRDSVAVQIHPKARFCIAAHDVGHGAAAHLRVGVEHDALRVDDLHVAALVGRTDIDECFLLRRDREASRTVLRFQRRPVAGDGVSACKGGLGEQILDRLQSAARIARVHGDGLRRLKEQGEGVVACKGIKCARTDGKLHRGRGDVCHAEHRDMQLTFDQVIGVAAAARMHRSAVHVDHKVCGLGIALGDLYREGVVLTVLCNGIAGDGVALAARQGDPIGHHDGDGDAHGVARDVRGGDDVRLVVRLDQEGVERGGDGAAVDRHGEFVLVADGELDAAVVDAAVGNAGDDRCGRVGRGDVAAAAELFVRIGDPAAVVLMRDNGNVREDRIAAVGDLAVVVIPVAQSVCEAVDGPLAVDGDLAERDARIERDAGGKRGFVSLPDLGGRDRDGVALDGLDGQGAAGIGNELCKFTGVERQLGVGLYRDVAGKLHAAMDVHLAAGFHEDCAVDAIAAGAVQHSAIVYGDQAGDLAGL